MAAAGLLALASAACADLGVDPQPQPDPQEELLFVSTRGDDRQVAWTELMKDIYRMNADGTGVVNLTRQPAARYRSLSLSPDGNKVVFNTDRSGCYDLWMMNTDGSSPQRLTGVRPNNLDRCNYIPRWSPDGSRIAFMTTRDRNHSTYVMEADGTSPRSLSAPVMGEFAFAYPIGWSPDGRVAFNYMEPVQGGAPVRTYVVKADGTGLTPLFTRAGDHSPAWSPDGSRIAFLSDRNGADRLFVMNADGSNLRQLSTLTTGSDEFAPSWGFWENDASPWSPDGTRIAFTHSSAEGAALYVVNADGSDLRRLTQTSGAKFNGWSPSGTRIAFTSDAAGSYDVYVINADGTGQVNLTPGAWHETDALWLRGP